MATKKAPKQSTPSKPAYSLDEVESRIPAGNPAVESQLRELFHTAHSDAALIALGSGFRTEDILATAPSFLAQVADQVARLDAVDLPLGLAKEHAGFLFAESVKLTELNQHFEDAARRNQSEVSKRRSQLKIAQSEALTTRRVVARTLLRQVLAPQSPRRAELERAAARAETPAGIAASVSTVADIVDAVRAETPTARRPALDALGLRASLPDEMRALAKKLEELGKITPSNTPAPPVGQRELDRQDGIVLALIKHVHSSMRDAGDGRITAPRIIGPLERLVVSVAGSDEDESSEPAAPLPEPTEPS